MLYSGDYEILQIADVARYKKHVNIVSFPTSTALATYGSNQRLKKCLFGTFYPCYKFLAYFLSVMTHICKSMLKIISDSLYPTWYNEEPSAENDTSKYCLYGSHFEWNT